MKYAFMLQYPLMGLKDIFQIEIKETVVFCHIMAY